MKKTFYFLPLLCLCVLLSGCSKEETNGEAVESGLTLETTEVNTYQMVTLNAENMILSDSYNGTFGGETIEIKKTSDTSLSFIVPDVSAGMYTFSFELLEDTELTVTKTVVTDPAAVIATSFANFDSGMEELLQSGSTVTAEDITRMNTLKANVESYYASLDDDVKMQVALLYEANKEVYQNFKNTTFYNLDAATAARQSECPDPSYSRRDFYFCTCTNLGESLSELRSALRSNLEMLGMAGVAALLSLNPALTLVGLGTFGVALAATAYIFVTEVLPAVVKVTSDIPPFLHAQWVLGEQVVDNAKASFSSSFATDLDLEPTLRSIHEDDTELSSQTSFFITGANKVKSLWNNFVEVLGSFPLFQNNEQDITLETNQIIISNISNSDVQLMWQNGESAIFESTSGETETFNYDITVTVDGFTRSKTVTGATVTVEESLAANWLLKEIVVNNTTIYPDQWTEIYDTCPNGGSYLWNDVSLYNNCIMVITDEGFYSLPTILNYVVYNVDYETCTLDGTSSTDSETWTSNGEYTMVDGSVEISNWQNTLFNSQISSSMVVVDSNHIEYTEVGLQNEEVGPPTQYTIIYKLERQL